MQSLQSIKQRLTGVKNIGQITKAMELVAATKMRKSQEIALASRPYAFAALELLANLTRIESSGDLPPILQKRPVQNTLILVVTSDKGLAGSFNSAVLRTFDTFVKKEHLTLPSPKYHFVGIGTKAIAHLKKYNVDLIREFIRTGDYTKAEETAPIADIIIEGYLNERWNRVIVFSTHFRNALRQEVLVQEILPIQFETLRSIAHEVIPTAGKFSTVLKEGPIDTATGVDYLLEPDRETLLSTLAEHLVTMHMYHIILEANASEHAARRTAMKNASDSAKDIWESLTLEYNKSRQAGITAQIIEISAGADSLSS